jgi:hypothetical protein
MTPQQMDDVLFVFKSGIACGLTTFEECILNWQNHVSQLYGYSEIAEKEKEMYTSLAEFYKGTGGSEEEDKALAVLDADTVKAYISGRIDAQRKAYERRHTEG